MSVFDRILNMSPLYQEEVIYNAILNLTDIKDIQEFVETYKRRRPERWKNDISYALGHFDREERTLWDSAVGDIIGISIGLNRSERELYTAFTFVDDKGEELEVYVNQETGTHTSK